MNEDKIMAIREAMRVITAMEERASVYSNRMRMLFYELDQDEDQGAIEYWEELFDEIIEYHREAEKLKTELLESMETYIDVLHPNGEVEASNPHPLLKRSGKR